MSPTYSLKLYVFVPRPYACNSSDSCAILSVPFSLSGTSLLGFALKSVLAAIWVCRKSRLLECRIAIFN